jgi:hypothetical protein
MRSIAFVLVFVFASAACAIPAPPAADRILGEWRGTSICINSQLAPACHDEIIHYVFSARARGAYHQAAYKIVDGAEDLMGEADLTYSAADNRWSFAFDARTCAHCTWWYRIDAADHLTGGITSQSGVELRRVSAERVVR